MRRGEFSISGGFSYNIIYYMSVSLLHIIIIIIILALPNSAKSTFSRSLAQIHTHTYTLTRRYFTSHHTYSGKKIPIHHYKIHYTYVYILLFILYKIRNTMIIIKGHGDEVYYRVVIVLECPWFFFILLFHHHRVK